MYRVNHGRLEDAVYTHHCSIWSEIHSQDGGSNRKIEGILYISIPGMLESHHLAHINQLNSIDFLLMLGRILLKSNKAYWILNSYFAVILSGLTLTYHDSWMPVSSALHEWRVNICSLTQYFPSYCLLQSKKTRVDMHVAQCRMSQRVCCGNVCICIYLLGRYQHRFNLQYIAVTLLRYSLYIIWSYRHLACKDN